MGCAKIFSKSSSTTFDNISSNNALIDLLEKFYSFYKSNSEKNNLLMLSSIHWLLYSQSYQNSFEIFDSQYKVLDALYKLCFLKKIVRKCEHSIRIIEIINGLNNLGFDIKIPQWATFINKKSLLSDIRNAFIHEALIQKNLIGYNYIPKNIHKELIFFNSRIILALIGCNSEYVNSYFSRDRKFIN
jgi:hypothetical protein